MPRKKYVTITKDNLKGEVVETAVPTWERNGWTVVDDGDSETATEEAPVVTAPKAQPRQPEPQQPAKQQP